MGAGLSLPDGSELKEPEEKVEHLIKVRANMALVFVKPHACVPDAIEFVKAELLAAGLKVLGECSMGAEAIAEKGIMDQHYAGIATNANEGDASTFKPDEETKAAFQEKFGQNFDDVVAAGQMLNAKACAEQLGTPADPDSGAEADPISGKDLNNLWLASPAIVKVASNAYVGKVRGAAAEEAEDSDEEEAGGGEEPLYCVNGFYPFMKGKFEKEDASVRLFVVAFDPQQCSWAKFRGEIIGKTNPADAAPGSIRAKILAQWEALGLPECPDKGDNGVHASAGPLEGLKERMVWLGFELEKDPVGSRLCELAVWDEAPSGAKRPVIADLLANSDVDVAGKKGSAFDLLEDKDTPDMYELANNVAFAAELEGVC